MRAIVALADPAKATISIYVPGDLPLFNQDIEAGPLPASVEAWRELAHQADAFIFATNEYNFSISGVLKVFINPAELLIDTERHRLGFPWAQGKRFQ